MDSPLLIDQVLSPASSPSGLILIQGTSQSPAWPLINHLLLKQNLPSTTFDALMESTIPSKPTLLQDLTESFFKHSSQVIYNVLGNLKLKSTIFIHLQTDLLDPLVQATLEYLSVASLRMLSQDRLGLSWRKAGGKIIKESFKFDVDSESYSAGNFQIAKVVPLVVETQGKPAVLPMASFNLSISEEQRKIKDALVLPYTRLTLEDEERDKASQSNKQILAPDFDDEDPDDDLEI